MYEPVRKALFPGVLVGILCILMVANLATSPGIALAASAAPFVEQVSHDIPAVRTPDAPSLIDALLHFFLPLIFHSDVLLPELTPEPKPEPAPDPGSGDVEKAPLAEQNCAVSPGFSENVRRWCDVISRTAAEQGLDANIIAAVMMVESGGNPDAYSRSGAVGLMQVMPRDGIAASFTCINGPCFAKRPSMAELYDPEFNLQYAGGMLAGLINRHGTWREALFAYGPAGVGYSYADKVLGIYERSR